MTKIEEMARIIEPDAWSWRSIPIWPTRAMLRRSAMSRARTAVEAMRKLTVEMEREILAHILTLDPDESAKQTAAELWSDTIDAILKEQP